MCMDEFLPPESSSAYFAHCVIKKCKILRGLCGHAQGPGSGTAEKQAALQRARTVVSECAALTLAASVCSHLRSYSEHGKRSGWGLWVQHCPAGTVPRGSAQGRVLVWVLAVPLGSLTVPAGSGCVGGSTELQKDQFFTFS